MTKDFQTISLISKRAKDLGFILLSASLWGQDTTASSVLIGLTVMDVVTTNYIMATGGIELNPLLPADNLFALAAIRGIIVVAYLATKPPKLHIWILNIITSTAVVNNLWQIHKHQRIGS